MNAPEKVGLNVYQRLNAARKEFHSLKLKKTGHNKFAGYYYFELGDFLIPALDVFERNGLCATVSFDRELASMTIRCVERPEDSLTITSPFSSAALKGCHEVQNVGAVETYQRRYLWVAALEIVEHDAIDSSKPLTVDPDGQDGGERFSTGGKPPSIRLPKLTDEEAAHEYNKWIQVKVSLVDGEGDADQDAIANAWGKLPSNVRSAIKRYGESISKPQVSLAEQA